MPTAPPPTFPEPLSPGAPVAVIAPSGSFSRVRFERGVATLGDRYEVRVGASVHERDGYLAGSDEARARDLLDALGDPEVRAIIAARGGFGATRLLPSLPLEAIQQSPKWLVGFSDATALHARWAAAGVASIHGPMVCSLPEAPGEVQRAYFDLLEGDAPSTLRGESFVTGEARGRLAGGNLALLTALCGTPYAPVLRGRIVLLEDIAERPYRIDRMLTTLLQAGAFDGVAGFALGQFTDCEPGADEVPFTDALRRNLEPLGVPVVSELRIGHVRDNHAVVLGREASVDANRGELRFP